MGSDCGPDRHPTSSNKRAKNLKLLLCAMALLLGATAGHTQWLETKIILPDSLGGAILPTCLTTDTSERYVYIGDGSGAVYVVDAEARTRVARIPSGYVYAMCTSTRRNKVYAADCVGNRVLAISCATNQWLRPSPQAPIRFPYATTAPTTRCTPPTTMAVT